MSWLPHLAVQLQQHCQITRNEFDRIKTFQVILVVWVEVSPPFSRSINHGFLGRLPRPSPVPRNLKKKSQLLGAFPGTRTKCTEESAAVQCNFHTDPTASKSDTKFWNRSQREANQSGKGISIQKQKTEAEDNKKTAFIQPRRGGGLWLAGVRSALINY